MMRRTTFTAAPMRMDDGTPAVAVVAYPEAASHAYSYLVTVDAANELARQVQAAADDAQARFGAVTAPDPEPGSAEDLAHWPPPEIDVG